MKYNLYTNKFAQYTRSLILIVVFTLVSIGASSEPQAGKTLISQMAISNYLAAQQEPNLSDEEKIRAAIDAYLTTRYEGQKFLQPQDFSTLIEDGSQA